jgi:hypothetical protein
LITDVKSHMMLLANFCCRNRVFSTLCIKCILLLYVSLLFAALRFLDRHTDFFTAGLLHAATGLKPTPRSTRSKRYEYFFYSVTASGQLSPRRSKWYAWDMHRLLAVSHYWTKGTRIYVETKKDKFWDKIIDYSLIINVTYRIYIVLLVISIIVLHLWSWRSTFDTQLRNICYR